MLHVRHLAGLTLIELMVTISIVAILAALAVPNISAFLVRNQTSSISSQFASDVNRARIEAISRNSCVTICQSVTTESVDPDNPPSCTTSGSDWNRGWIMFEDSTCMGTENDPDIQNLISVRQSGPSNFRLSHATGSALLRVDFDSRGMTRISSARTLTLAYLPESAGTSKNYRTIVVSSAGRVLIKQY